MRRTRARLDGSLPTTETCCGITSLTPERATPERLLALSRGHWAIENRLHWVRDVTFDEDHSQVRKGHAPQMLAALRNTAIGLLRLAGATSIAPTLRHLATHVELTLRLIGLPMPHAVEHAALARTACA